MANYDRSRLYQCLTLWPNMISVLNGAYNCAQRSKHQARRRLHIGALLAFAFGGREGGFSHLFTIDKGHWYAASGFLYPETGGSGKTGSRQQMHMRIFLPSVMMLGALRTPCSGESEINKNGLRS